LAGGRHLPEGGAKCSLVGQCTLGEYPMMVVIAALKIKVSNCQGELLE